MSQTNPFTALLAAQPFVLLDGAMATELEARGCDLADSLWSAKVLLENPQLIRDVHLDYFRAGAQVAITASYQATPAGFTRAGWMRRSPGRNRQSVELARKAREAYLAENPQAGTLLVAGSVGPYGAFRRRLGVSRRLSAQRGRVPCLPPPARRSAAGCRRRPAGL